MDLYGFNNNKKKKVITLSIQNQYSYVKLKSKKYTNRVSFESNEIDLTPNIFNLIKFNPKQTRNLIMWILQYTLCYHYLFIQT